MTETAKLEALDAETIERRIHLWFFRDLNTAQREKLFRLCFHPIEIGPTHDVQNLALRRIISPLSPPTGGWKPIETADKSIAVDMQFPGVPRMLHSYPIWVRCEGGKPFEASWVQRKADRPGGYWWDWDGEDVVDPDEWMPHPLQPLPSPQEAE